MDVLYECSLTIMTCLFKNRVQKSIEVCLYIKKYRMHDKSWDKKRTHHQYFHLEMKGKDKLIPIINTKAVYSIFFIKLNFFFEKMSFTLN